MEQNTKTNIEDIYELSPMQQGMLFHTLYTEGSDAYIEQFCYHLSGTIDEALFRRAWEEVVSRHGVMRTSFQWKGISKPVQLVNKKVELPWQNFDWSNLSEEQQIIDFKNFIKQDRAESFEMEKAPLMRCTLIKLNEASYEFIWSFHHIVLDGWSYPVLQKEVFTFYEAFKNGSTADLPKPLPYKQFILWLNKQDQSASEKYWLRELKGFNSPTKININFESATKDDKSKDEIDVLQIKLSSKLTAELHTFAKQNQLTLNTIMQGAWSVILSTYSGELDVVFGGVVSGRNPDLRGIESMAGLFINTLPVRIKIDYDQEILPWLKKLQTDHIERNEYSYSSLVDIQQSSELPRGSQLFDNILVFENYPLDKSLENGVAGIKLDNIRAFERTSFPLTVLIAPGESFTISIAYETSNFHSSIIEQILSNFSNLLESILTNKTGKLSGLSLLSKQEENKILSDWNDTRHDFPGNMCVHELFELQTEKTPEAIAVELDNKKLTYQELNERSNKVANYLQKSVTNPGVMIGICIERSLEMVIGLLGILKAGCAYVPLDSNYPPDRLAFMIEDTNITVLLTTQKLSGKIPKTSAKLILIDSDADLINKESKSHLKKIVSPSDLAYVIYTSGSTGKPKGVLMKHEALTNLLYWQVEGQQFGKGYRTLQFTTLSFDVSFQEIFSTWYSGGTLVMMTEEDRQDFSNVLQIIKGKKIERLFLPFIALHQLAELYSGFEKEPLMLKEVYTAGEQLQNTPAIINFFNDLKDFTFSNHYGPSEAHVVTSYTLNREPKTWVYLPPIGKPIYNTQMYILNSRLKPVPVGVSGDLYIGGTGLVKGYHNRHELTNEKFINNPIDTGLSKKIYKTGDIARYLPDGNIEYLGRTDNQIKMRGFRIELGEIESVLGEYSGVKSAAVAAKVISAGDKRLIAYIVSQVEQKLSSSELKTFLKSKLPEYMVPTDYVFIKEMPMTPSGKVDQRALPELEFSRVSENSNYTEPKDSLELQLVKIWEKVLGVKPIGIKDNFFELGGHSLLALRVFGYIEKLTGRKLALSTLFSSPTVKELAVILKDDGWTPPWKSLVAVKPGGSKLPFYCVPPGAGTALHFQDMIKYIPEDQPFYVLESLGLDGKETPHTELEDMAAFYVKEIQSLQPDGPYMLGGRCFGGRVAFEMAQQLARAGQKIALLAIFDTWPPFIALPQSHLPQERDLKHFITRSYHHLKTGELVRVAWKYSSNKFLKMKWKVTNKIEYAFSNSKKRWYKHIMLSHFNAQDRYIAKKYPGKITLIECSTFKQEYREGWKNLAEGGFEAYVVPNTNHKTIVKEPQLRLFADKLNFVLEKTHNELNERQKSNGIVNHKHLQKKPTVIIT